MSTVCLSVKTTAHCHCHCNFTKTNYLDNNCFSRLKDFPFAFRCFRIFLCSFPERERERKNIALFTHSHFHWNKKSFTAWYPGCGHSSSWAQFAFQVVFSLLRSRFCFYVYMSFTNANHFSKWFEWEKNVEKLEHTRIKLSKLSSKSVGLRVINIEHHWQWCSWQKGATKKNAFGEVFFLVGGPEKWSKWMFG